MVNLKDDDRCFACGKDNPIGLKLEFTSNNGNAISDIIFSKDFEGWEGIVHGGIVSTVLDEVMVKAAGMEGFRCVTAEINVKYTKPCLSEKKHFLRGKVSDKRKNIIFTEGEIADEAGNVIAKASGKLFIVNPDILNVK